MGKDFTLFSKTHGLVKFRNLKGKKYIDVVAQSAN
jgi:ribosomal protein L27